MRPYNSVNIHARCLILLDTLREFKTPGSFEPTNDMIGGGCFRLNPGQWTDDTSMALCLAESLVKSGGFDAKDQMERYVRWWKEGYLSSTGTCFDIGNTISGALGKFLRTADPIAGSTDEFSAGNGSIMRLAPVPLFFFDNPELAIQMAGESSRTTHGTAEAVDGCRYLAALIVGALQGCPKEELLSAGFTPVPGLWERESLAVKIAAVAAGSFKEKEPPEVKGSGYVVESLEAALWAFHHGRDFRDGALKAVNLGDDADTTGAVYGQLAGALYGVEGIPEEWLEKISMREYIEELADGMLSGPAASSGRRSSVGANQLSPPVPFPRSFWVEPGRFLAGFYPGDIDKKEAEKKLFALLDAGIRCFVNLVEEEEKGQGQEPLRSYYSLLTKLAKVREVEVTYARIPIRDVNVPSASTMKAILDVIDRALCEHQSVYVHCWGGRGRTGTVVGCYLVRYGISTGEEALRRIAHLRRDELTANMAAPENEIQRDMVCTWKEGE